MIFLFTGIPGTGKTSLVVDMLANDKRFKKYDHVYVDGIPELKIPHEPIPEGHSMEDWQKWVPKRSLLVIDEAQRIFAAMPNGSKMPDYIAALNTHRHMGVDFIVITQHPRLLHTNLKSNVEEHFHISKTYLGRQLLNWKGAKNPDNLGDRKVAVKTPYRLKKRSFDLYRSSEAHTKLTTKTPWFIWFGLLVLIGTGYAVWTSYDGITNLAGTGKDDLETVAAGTQGAASADTSGTGAFPSPTQTQPVLSVNDYVPRIPERPETKPMYDNVRQVQTFEFPNMCIERKSTGDCKCYSHQATLIKDIPKEFCREYVENGIFNPYKARTDSQSQPVSNIKG